MRLIALTIEGAKGRRVHFRRSEVAGWVRAEWVERGRTSAKNHGAWLVGQGRRCEALPEYHHGAARWLGVGADRLAEILRLISGGCSIMGQPDAEISLNAHYRTLPMKRAAKQRKKAAGAPKKTPHEITQPPQNGAALSDAGERAENGVNSRLNNGGAQ